MKAIRNLNLRSVADSRVEQYRRILQLIVNVIGQRRKICNKSVFFATYDQSLACNVLPVVYDRIDIEHLNLKPSDHCQTRPLTAKRLPVLTTYELEVLGRPPAREIPPVRRKYCLVSERINTAGKRVCPGTTLSLISKANLVHHHHMCCHLGV